MLDGLGVLKIESVEHALSDNFPAVRANAIHVVTSDAFLVPGPRVVEVAETLASWLHGIQAR